MEKVSYLNVGGTDYELADKQARNDIELKADKTALQSVASGSPAGTYANLEALQSAEDTDKTRIYLTLDNGNWNYWNGDTWVSGGLYQAAQVSEEALNNHIQAYDKIKDIFSENLWKGTVSGSVNTGSTVVSYPKVNITCPVQYAGAYFIYKVSSPKMRVRIKATYTTSDCSLTIYYKDKEGGLHFGDNIYKSTGGSIDEHLYFDISSILMYDNADEIGVVIRQLNSNSFGIIKITELEINQLVEDIQQNDIYDENFITLQENIINGIKNLKSSNANVITDSDLLLKDANGIKYKMLVDTEGNLVLTKTIPTNVLILGNSITLGWDTNGEYGGAFGLCATSSKKDWVHYLKEELENKTSDVNITKLHDATFEQAENAEQSEAYISDNKSMWENKNLDLVLIQIGDNVNTDARRTNFAQNLNKLITSIRKTNPKARLIFISCWFNQSNIDTIKNVADSYGCELVDISLLYKKENLGTIGAEVTFNNGNKTTITEQFYTHPGDKGMESIANFVLEKINL